VTPYGPWHHAPLVSIHDYGWDRIEPMNAKGEYSTVPVQCERQEICTLGTGA